jgi:hypothetical protein
MEFAPQDISAADHEPGRRKRKHKLSKNAPSAPRRSARSRGTTSDDVELLHDQGMHVGTTAPHSAGRSQLGLVFILALLALLLRSMVRLRQM